MKLAKLSLAAIVAVGAMTTIASAQPLEEAIKGVEFSGFMEFQVNDVSKDADKSESTGYAMDFLGKVTSPVADNLKATVAFASSGSTDTGFKSSASHSGVEFDIRKAFFTYAQDGITVIAGLQDLKTPVTNNGFNGQKGEGVVAMYNMGQVTAAAAYFGNTTLASKGSPVYTSEDDSADYADENKELNARDVFAAGLMGSYDAVSGRAWYVQSPESVDRLYFLEASASMLGASLTAQYTSLKADAADAETGKFYAVKGAYKYEGFGISATYTKNDEDQPVFSLFSSGDTEVIGSGWRLQNSEDVFNQEKTWGIEGTYGFDKYGFVAGYAKADTWVDLDSNTNTEDVEEMYVGASYQYSKNFATYARFADIKNDTAADADYQYLRFDAKYSF